MKPSFPLFLCNLLKIFSLKNDDKFYCVSAVTLYADSNGKRMSILVGGEGGALL